MKICGHGNLEWVMQSGNTVAAGQNVQDEPTAESAKVAGAETANEPRAGSGSAPSSCSALRGA